MSQLQAGMGPAKLVTHAAHHGWVCWICVTDLASFSRPRSSIAASWFGSRRRSARIGSNVCSACSSAGTTCHMQEAPMAHERVRLAGF